MRTHIATIARLSGALLLLFFVALVLGEGPPNPLRLTTRESLYALCLAALYGGLALAWYQAAWGGLLSLAGWAFLAILSKRLPLDWPLALPAATGLVHLVCARVVPGASAVPRPRWMTFLLYGLVPLFVLLCVNETFGDPPLMAAPERPVAHLAGVWSDEHASLTIAADGAVTGAIGHTPIISAHLNPNRSWFGRLLSWRTDYRIRGATASGQPFNVLLNADPPHLTGTVELSGHAGHSRIRLQRR